MSEGERSRVRPDVQLAVKHAGQLGLLSVTCDKISAEFAPMPPNTSLRYKLEKMKVDWIRFGDVDFVVMLPFLLTVSIAEDDSEPKPAGNISVWLRNQYRAKEPDSVPEDELSHVLSINGYMHAWPYFRADVQFLTAKCGLPALTLPVVLSGEVADRVEVGTIAIEPAAAKADTAVPNKRKPVETTSPRRRAKRQT